MFVLPKIGKAAVELSHFPTAHQAVIFRAYEYVPAEIIAQVLGTSSENVRRTAEEMGLPEYDPGDRWLKRGYITIIRRLWHLLPYEQLLKMLNMNEDELAVVLREEDFLDYKLGDKPSCPTVTWRELTDEERTATAKVKAVMQTLDLDGKPPFAFEYHAPRICREGEERFKTRMIYAFSGLYQHAFDVDSEVYLSDELLEAYRDLGINGIWTQGVLSRLTEFPFDPSVSAGWEQRLMRLQALTERLDRYGIKLFLYINEPRSMPLAFFENYPQLRGHVRDGNASLCTSTEPVKEYLRSAIEKICRSAPLIGGFFCITRSENQTNCYSHSGDLGVACTCPRCREKSVGEVVADTVTCFLDGARRVSNDIKVFAWGWNWNEHSEEAIRRLPKEVILLSQSEHDVPFEIGGVKGAVRDYSIGILGPGEHAKKEWRIAKEYGHEVGAKVQINTTWEASTVPAVPVAPLVDEHMRRLQAEGVEHLILSWTLGGYPGGNVAAAAKYFYENGGLAEESPYAAAQEQFSEAFKEFPFYIDTLYRGPQNAGPSSMLFEKPTGYSATMTCFAYDDVENWRSIYPLDVFEDQFCRLCDGWKRGLEMLHEEDRSEVPTMARAAYGLFQSSLNQIRFVRARNDGRYADAIVAAENEIETARMMLEQMNLNAAIGYEAANHYYFSKGQLAEKIVNCYHVIEVFKQKLQ